MPFDHNVREGITPPSYDPATVRLRLYAASLDEQMCESCAALAGREFASNDPDMPILPNPNCTAAHGCRCGWLTLDANSEPAEQ